VQPEPNGTGGVEVTMVSPGSRGDKLGLRVGDVIRRVNDNRIDDAAGLRRVLTETKEPLDIIVKRVGEEAVLRLREKAE
jgi:S1-C subfamily serine protease